MSKQPQHDQQENLDGMKERLFWLVMAMLAISMPLWYELVVQPGEAHLLWRWTEQQIAIETLVSIVHFAVVVAGVFMLKRAVGYLPQWPIVRAGAWVWAGLVGIFALFSIFVFQVGTYEVDDSYQGDNFAVNFVRTGGFASEEAELFEINVILSCNQRGLYKNILFIDRFVGADDVEVIEIDDEEVMAARYYNEGTEIRTQYYDLASLVPQCKAGNEHWEPAED